MTASESETEDPAFDASTFYVVGGTLATDAPSYVTRQADRQLREALWRGDFCYVLDTRQVGKSSLMVRAASFLKQQGIAVAILDLTRLGQSLNPEQWYYGLLLNLGAQIGRRDEARAFWQQNRELGPMQRCMEALRQIVPPASAPPLPTAHSPRTDTAESHPRLVVFIDEIDNVLNLPFDTDEFFAAIRECYTRRAHDPAMSGLTFCLLGSTTPDSLIRDVRTTPFNIGIRIEPTDFTLDEAAPLKEGVRSRLSEVGYEGASSTKMAQALLARVLYWTGGHPYLTQRLCRAVMEALSTPGAPNHFGAPDTRHPIPFSSPTPDSLVDRLCAQLFFTKAAREGESNLTFVSNRILKSEVDQAALLDLLMQVRANKHVKNDPANPLCTILRLSGMVRVADGTLEIRNQIYRHVFDLQWIRANMPDAEWRRQRQAYRRGQVRAGAVLGLIAIALVLSVVALSIIQKAAISRAHEAQTLAANLKLQRALEQQKQALQLVQKEKRHADDAAHKADIAATQEKLARNDADYQRRMALEQSKEATAAYELARKNEHRAEENAQRALRFASEAKHANSRLMVLLRRDERFVYPSRIQLADRMLQQGDVAAARGYLQQCIPPPYQADIRGFEWRFMMNQCRDQSFLSFAAHPGGVNTLAYCPGGSLIASTGREERPTPEGRPAPDSRPPDARPMLDGRPPDSRPSPDGRPPDGRPPDARPPDGNSFPTTRLAVWDAATGRLIAGVHIAAFRSYRGVTFSHDGQRLAVFEGGSAIHLMDVTTLTPDHAIQLDAGARAMSVAFSPDDSILASADTTGLIALWDASTGQRLRSLEHQNGGINNLIFSPNGEMLCATFRGSGDVIGKLFEVRTGREIATLNRRPDLNVSGQPTNCLAFSADSQYVAIGTDNHQLYLWQTRDGRLRNRLVNRQYEFTALAFSPDNHLLITGSNDGMLRAWDADALEGGKPFLSQFLTLHGHTGAIHTMIFAPDGRTLATAGNDGNIKQWNILSLAASHYKAGADIAREVIYTADGKLLARVGSPYRDGHPNSDSEPTVRIYDAATLQERVALESENPVGFWAAAFSPDGHIIATSADDRTVRLWDTRTGRQISALQGVQEQVHALAFSPDGRLLATGGQGMQVRLWSVQSGQTVAKLDRTAAWIETLAFSPDGALLVTGDGAGELRWWDVAGRHEIVSPAERALRRQPGRVRRSRQEAILALAFAPNGRWLATSGTDNLIHTWSVARRQQIATLRGHLDAVWALAFSADSKTLASGSKDGAIKFWVPNSEQDSPVQEALTQLPDQSAVQSLAFAPDGKTLVSGHFGGAMLFWRAMDISTPPLVAEKRTP